MKWVDFDDEREVDSSVHNAEHTKLLRREVTALTKRLTDALISDPRVKEKYDAVGGRPEVKQGTMQSAALMIIAREAIERMITVDPIMAAMFFGEVALPLAEIAAKKVGIATSKPPKTEDAEMEALLTRLTDGKVH